MKAKLLILLFLTFLLNLPISEAAKIKPANISDEELMERVKNDPPDEVKVSFWQLPLWIKIHHIVTVILGLLTAWKLLPIVVTKIKSALESVKRRRILRVIMENQGVSLTELEKITGENRSTLRYHLSKLEGEGWIRTIKVGNSKLVLLNTSELNPEIVGGRKKDIVELLEKHGRLTAKQIAERLDLNVKTVYYHLRELKERGIVKKEGNEFKLTD